MKKLNLKDLTCFTGTEHLYQLPFCKKFTYTDGIKYLAGTYSMYWLLADLALTHLPRALANYPDWFYCVTLAQSIEHEADLVFTDGNDLVIYRHHYYYVDFVFDNEDNETETTQLKLFIQMDDDNSCLMLPTEY